MKRKAFAAWFGLFVVLALFRGSAAGAISDCMDATCRITAGDGSRGSGCVFEINRGFVYVLTAAHVVGNGATVQCEFWRHGHQSQPLAATVLSRSQAADAAIVAVPEAALGGVLPKIVPLAPRGYVVRPGDTLTSVGCANGAWSTGWKGHALGYDGDDLRFLPTPANGRSGSAIFDARGERIVAIVRARTGDNSQGIATSVQAIYRAFDYGQSGGTPAPQTAGRMPALQNTQCGPGGCPTRPQPWQNHLLPYRYRHDQQQPDAPRGGQAPWPSLPPAEAAPGKSSVDVAPLDDKLGRIAGMLEELKNGREPATPGPQAPAVDDQARRAAEAALGQLSEVRAEAQQGVREAKADAAKAHEAVGGLTGVVEKIRDSIAENGTLSQRFHARVDKVKAELEERLGREATDREVRIAYVKDLVQDKIADGGLVGLAKVLGLPAGLVLVIWLVTRDVKHKRETGDPLAVEKLATLIEGKVGVLRDRIESLRDRLHPAAPSEPPKPAG